MASLGVLILLPALLAACEPCGLKINVTVFQDVDSAGENLTTEGRIENKKDIFRLLVANASVPRLCPGAVFIQNELSVLQIVNSSLREIEPGAFDVAPTLALVRIVRNPLAAVRRNVFNAIKVKELDLSRNRIAAVDTDAFDNNTHLEIVQLNDNQLTALDPGWFLNSPRVYKLSAVYNDIKAVPAEAFRNMDRSRPLKLRLSANRITRIDPDAFRSHRAIQLLRIDGNKLTALPENIFRNTTIRNLQVSTNHLQCFPDVMFHSGLSTLAFVDNVSFECECLKKVRRFAEDRKLEVLYPSIICEDRAREVNIVFNYNKTYEIPLLPPTVDVDVYVEPEQPT